ncbi:MAG: sulfite exporter TauE/SafE family protein [Patescibacteria group bacterium]|jgi:sulfite exporter TauE/SafE/copper chaperone CopZ
MRILKFNVTNLHKDNAASFETASLAHPGVKQVETWQGRAEIKVDDSANQSALINELKANGFELVVREQVDKPTSVTKVHVDGMTCRSCELTIERKLMKLPGVAKVDANAGNGKVRLFCYDAAPNLKVLQNALGDEKYTVRPFESKTAHQKSQLSKQNEGRPSFGKLIVLFGGVFVVGWFLSRLGLFSSNYQIGTSVGFTAAIVLGLIAGSSSCLAVAGGLLLSSASKFHERYGNQTFVHRMRPVGLFITGRILSYGMLGGLIGYLGKSLTPSPLITGALTILAALYMLTMGLDMLHLAPRWLKALMPRMPKSIGHKIMDAEGKDHWVTPFLLGGATFFLPCGFTQSLQLYALTTGSFTSSAITLAAFALGTAPALFALGWASSSLKGKSGRLFFQFAGAVVIVLGLLNIQNGLAVSGYSLSLPSFAVSSRTATAGSVDDSNVIFDGKTSNIKMRLTDSSPYYSPSDEFTVRAGYPVHIQIDGYGTGCRAVFQIPRLNVETLLDKQVNIVDFTPTRAGDYTFSCSMGMYRGTLRVI